MKRLLTALFLTSCFSILPNTLLLTSATRAQTTANESELFYTFYGQKIPLSLKQDTIAVRFKPISGTRSPGMRPLHQQLQETLSGNIGTRSLSSVPKSQIEVKPLGDNYAIIQVPTNTRSSDLINQVRQQSYVEGTLPVLARPAKDKLRDESIILPNEIVLSLESGLSPSQVQVLLNRYHLEVIRPLRFTQNRYIVRSRTATGTQVLNVSNRLLNVPGIQSATPNFIQSIQFTTQEQSLEQTSASSQRISEKLAALPQPEDSPLTSNLLPLQWHLNSTPKRGRLLPRTDIRATAAWRDSKQGKDIVVAVIDSLIQWDHTDLANNIYSTQTAPDRLPNEEKGWDFTSPNGGDPDTRISEAELEELRPGFQDTFKLSDADLLKKYKDLAARVRRSYPDYSNGQVASLIRNYMRSNIAAEFHGTWASGVVAARPQAQQGVFGVAPQAKILPVRVFGLKGEITEERLIEAIGYSAARGVNVINMSLGGLLPSQGLTDQVFKVLDANPKLTIVASAGNDSLDGVSFPAAIPGVISVGATSMEGARSFYSSFGGRLDVVAPGGETQTVQQGGILTTGGTALSGFWQGMTPPDSGWGMALDPQGSYVQVQGTSFSAPIISGVVALMQGERKGELNRDRIQTILKQTASYQTLQISNADATQYRLQAAIGFGTALDFPFLRPSGIYKPPTPVSAEQYYFGSGLVNAEAAVKAAKS